jgi:hypothetical protein
MGGPCFRNRHTLTCHRRYNCLIEGNGERDAALEVVFGLNFDAGTLCDLWSTGCDDPRGNTLKICAMTPTLTRMVSVDPSDFSNRLRRVCGILVFGEAGLPAIEPPSTEPHHVAANHDFGPEFFDLQPESLFVRLKGASSSFQQADAPPAVFLILTTATSPSAVENSDCSLDHRSQGSVGCRSA